MIIKINDYCEQFAKDKDFIKTLREEKIQPYFNTQLSPLIVLDFENVDTSDQSFQTFIHNLLSGLFQDYGDMAFEYLDYQNCNDKIKGLITIIIDNFIE